MAVKSPQFLAPDGVYRDNYILTTDRSSRFFTGQTPADTVDMQVRIRGAGWTSDPDFIYFTGNSFIIPNPSAYPQGLRLLPGSNRIEVKAVLTSGNTTGSGVIEANLSLDRDVKAGVLAPSGIFVERFDKRVAVTVTGLTDPNVVGYNFYASIAPGGGTVGYTQINIGMVSSGTTVNNYSLVGTLPVDSTVALDTGGSQRSHPQYLRVVGTQVAPDGTVFQTDFDQSMVIPLDAQRLRTTMLVETVQPSTQFTFNHDRGATESSLDYPANPNADFNAIADTDPLYYVVTAVYLIGATEYESSFSPEVAASPMNVTPAIASLPQVTRQQIDKATTLAIYRSHPEADVKAGSVLRDTVIDPFTSEAERLRFIVGFLQAGQSMATLLAIDDPNSSGVSVSVGQSKYKQALQDAFFLKDSLSVQNMIDNMFDHLASRRGAIRRQGSRSQGEVVLYVTSKPTGTLTIPIGTQIPGGGGSGYATTSTAQISAAGGASFYNPTTGRYFTRAFIQANVVGSAGNVSAGQLRSIQGAPSGVQVINESPTFGGDDVESNRDLAARAEGVLSAVDSGTYRGYAQNAIEVAGVRQVNVVDSTHSLMFRDYDAGLKRHLGGKVDVWVRGTNTGSLTDSFAFSFQKKLNGQFEPVGDIANLLFRAVDPNLTAANPIIEMLVYPTWGLVFRNDTTGKVLNLTGATLVAPDKIQLSAVYNDPSFLHLSDAYSGSYRYRTSNKYVPVRQPVSSISQLVGEVSGTIPADQYLLYRGSDPLLLGRSVEAGDYLQVIQDSVVPSHTPVVVVDEHHVYLGGVEYLQSLGINPLTVHIWNADKTVEYLGPFHPTDPNVNNGNRDFTLIDEVGTTPLGFRALASARFIVGDDLRVDFEHDENFLLTYTSNSLVALTQNAIDSDRHVTADVLVKDTIPTGVNIKATVVLKKKQDVAKVNGLIRTNLARLFGSFGLGQPVRQSDISSVIDDTAGVSYVVTPLTTLCKANGSIILREVLVSESQGTDWVQVAPVWSTNLVTVFVLTQQLESGTVGSGGMVNDFRGVSDGPVALITYEGPPDVNGVPIKLQPGAAYIIGNEGLDIPGYSDDATIIAAYVLPSDPDRKTAMIQAIRKSLSARRVLLALPKGTTPTTGSYTVSYVVYDDSGVQNITPGPTDYLELGDLEFTWDEDTDFEALVNGTGRGR